MAALNRTNEVFMIGRIIDTSRDNLVALVTEISNLSADHLNKTLMSQVDTFYTCSISKNKLHLRRQADITITTEPTVVSSDIPSQYIDYKLLQHELNKIEGLGTLQVYAEERNQDTKFCSRVSSAADGTLELLLKKRMNFEKSTENEVRIVIRIETAEKVIINVMKVYAKDGTFQFKLEFILAVVDGLNGHESHEKLRTASSLLSKYIKMES
jgi:hypothetical protein